MAYQVNKFNGTFLTSVEDGTIDSSTDLRFVGKNYAGYGEVQNENYLHLMENFANTTAPPKVVAGQIWYDSGAKKLKFYDGAKFKIANGAEVSASQPSGLAAGEFWWDTTAKQLYTWSGTDYVLVGPQSSPDAGASSVSAVVVKDNAAPVANNHSIIKFISGGETVAILSPDEFTPGTGTGLSPQFTKVKKGFTLINTNAVTGVTSDDHVFWGTSSNALRLNGVLPSEYVRKGDPFTTTVNFGDTGFKLGDGFDLYVHVVNDELIVDNQLGNPIVMRITVEGTPNDVAVFSADGIIPGSDNVYDLGSSASAWSSIYAETVFANVTGTVTGTVTGAVTGNILAEDTAILVNSETKQIGYDGATLRGNLFGSVEGNLTGTASNANKLTEFSPSIFTPETVDKSSVPVRNAAGEINAVKFNGIATHSDKTKINDLGTDDVWSAGDQSTWYRSAMTTKTAYTIAARNSAGDLLANVFDGTATAAQYADLAEKYLADKEYEPGTVVMIGGDAEVTASAWGKRAIGVVSTNPAFMMNKDLEGGTYIALKGRVPVKVIGRIKKGEDLIATNDGCAMMAVPHASGVFAVALESSDDEGVKVIEALVL